MTNDIYQKILNEWQAKSIATLEQLDQRLDSFKVLFAYHSGKIENPEINFHDTHEIFHNNKVTSFTGDVRTIFEQQNQKFCYEFLKPKIVAKEPLSAQLIKKIHYILCAGTYDERRYNSLGERAGEYKKHDYVVGINEVGASPNSVEKSMQDLVQEVNQNVTKSVLLVATYLHAVFENIHPFADGNGRVGRTVMNYFLLTNNHPPIVIREEHKKDYYAALEAYDTKEDLNPLQNFLKHSCVQTWQKIFL